MGFFNRKIPRKIKYWLGWILRPRLAYLRIREARRATKAPPVRDNLSLSALPRVTLRLAETPRDLALVVDLYKRNPSSMNIAPRSIKALESMLSQNTEFYRIFDEKEECVGNYAYQVDRRMLCCLQIEYVRRSRGLALAAMQAIEQLLAQRGINVVYSQVYCGNRRALSTHLSLGWEILEEESTDEYLTLRKILIPPAP